MIGKHGVPRHSAGFTMVELLVSVVLGAILMSGAISVYLAAKRSYVEVEQVAALAENTSYAEEIVTDAVRHIGFFGEVAADKVNMFAGTPAVANDCTAPAAAYDVANFLYAVSSDGTGNAIGCITDAVPNTDVLVVKHVAPLPFSDGPRVSDPDNPVAKTGLINTPTVLATDKSYVMTNNVLAFLFDGGGAVPSTISDVPGGVAWEYQFEAYYVRNTAIPQLSRKVLSSSGTEMRVVTEDVVEGVENMRLAFGMDSDNDGEVDAFANAGEVGANWNQVLSIQVYLLVRSANGDAQYEDDKVYALGDLTVTPGGNFRRLVSRGSVSLRNPKLLAKGGAS